MFQRLRLALLRARIRRLHTEIEHHELYLRVAGPAHLDRLLRHERELRSQLFGVEHPWLCRGRPSRVYGSRGR
jgi:hypothetical protein